MEDCLKVLIVGKLQLCSYVSMILDNSFERVGFVALSDDGNGNKENRRQPLEDVESVNWCTHNALPTQAK
jgi:hypothetical protein